ncbi:hypothetical protein SNE40_000667 [Patella caerulea]|uniref:Uncharacterized protein n=2 Tax=Patella caerulea TaxID=87958 RepID=A0AAN8Q2I8_PATCE
MKSNKQYDKTRLDIYVGKLDQEKQIVMQNFQNEAPLAQNTKPKVPIRNTRSEDGHCWFSSAAENRINCRRLFVNDVPYINQVARYKVSASQKTCSLELLSKDCSRLKEFHGYTSWPVTIEEKDFPVAFSIKTHKSVRQAEQLLRTIWRPQNVYCIHVDKKAKPGIFETIKNIGSCFDNVYVLDERLDVMYTSIDMMQTDLMCMKKLLEVNSEWKYYINLSGQEYVLKTNLEIVKILKTLKGANDIESYTFPLKDYIRFQFVHQRSPERGFLLRTNTAKSPIPDRFSAKTNTIRKGSMYGCFTRGFVDFTLNSKIAKELISWAADVYAPEELVWPSLSSLPESPGNFLQRSYRFIEQRRNNFISKAVTWTWTKNHRCVGRYVRSVCIYSIHELSWLLIQPNIAANKFDEEFDQVVIDCLEESLYNRTFSQNLDNFNWYYYHHVPHVYGRH